MSAQEQVVCTQDDPWTPQKSACAIHPASTLVREEYDWSADHDDYEVRHCPHCGLTFRVTIPC